MNLLLPPLFGGFLNSLTVRAEPWVTNWLTPIWILGLGALAGVLIVLLLYALGFLLSRIAALSKLSENRNSRLVAGIVLALVLVGIATPWLIARLQAHWANNADSNRLVDVILALAPVTMASLIAGWALVVLMSRRTMEELHLLFQEGPLFWISVAVCSFALFGILGTVLVRDPESMLDSLWRWPQLGEKTYELKVPAPEGQQFEEPPEHRLELSPPLRRSELRQLQFQSDESVRVAAFPAEERANAPSFDVSGGEAITWRAAGPDPAGPFAELQEIQSLYARNFGSREAAVTITAQTSPATPEMLTVPIVATGVVGLFLLYLVLWGLLPKMTAIALATAKSEMNTPLYMLLTTVGAFLLFMFVWLPYNTFGEDIKMLKFTALDAMLFLAIFQAIWSASSSVAEEVEGRTALTVLSKPVGRRDFILGKFMGIAWIVLVMFVIYGSVTLLSVAYKPIFDAREGGKMPARPNVVDPLGIMEDPSREMTLSQDEINWEICFAEMAATIPAIMLVYAETLVMVAVSVAISTRLALVANVMICFAIYALGHLTPLLVQSNEVAERFEPVIFMGQLIAAVIPMLDFYNAQAAIAKGVPIQLAYVGATFLYTALYATIAMLVALVLFEDRDLA